MFGEGICTLFFAAGLKGPTSQGEKNKIKRSRDGDTENTREKGTIQREDKSTVNKDTLDQDLGRFHQSTLNLDWWWTRSTVILQKLNCYGNFSSLLITMSTVNKLTIDATFT